MTETKKKDEGHWYDGITNIFTGKAGALWDKAKDKLDAQIAKPLEQAADKITSFFTDGLVQMIKDGINGIVNWFTGFFTSKKIDLFGSNDPVNTKILQQMDETVNSPKPAAAPTPAPAAPQP